jgi:hypothetical protein
MILDWWLLIAGVRLVVRIVTAFEFPQIRLIGTITGMGVACAA